MDFSTYLGEEDTEPLKGTLKIPSIVILLPFLCKGTAGEVIRGNRFPFPLREGENVFLTVCGIFAEEESDILKGDLFRFLYRGKAVYLTTGKVSLKESIHIRLRVKTKRHQIFRTTFKGKEVVPYCVVVPEEGTEAVVFITKGREYFGKEKKGLFLMKGRFSSPKEDDLRKLSERVEEEKYHDIPGDTPRQTWYRHKGELHVIFREGRRVPLTDTIDVDTTLLYGKDYTVVLKEGFTFNPGSAKRYFGSKETYIVNSEGCVFYLVVDRRNGKARFYPILVAKRMSGKDAMVTGSKEKVFAGLGSVSFVPERDFDAYPLFLFRNGRRLETFPSSGKFLLYGSWERSYLGKSLDTISEVLSPFLFRGYDEILIFPSDNVSFPFIPIAEISVEEMSEFLERSGALFPNPLFLFLRDEGNLILKGSLEGRGVFASYIWLDVEKDVTPLGVVVAFPPYDVEAILKAISLLGFHLKDASDAKKKIGRAIREMKEEDIYLIGEEKVEKVGKREKPITEIVRERMSGKDPVELEP